MTISKDVDNGSRHPYRAIAGGDYRYQYDFKPLKKDHELFHCFFDFDNCPPPGCSDEEPIIEGIYLKRHLIGLYVNGYGVTWKNKDNRAQLKMGVNMVVYALTRKKARYTLTRNRWVTGIKPGKWMYLASGPIKSW